MESFSKIWTVVSDSAYLKVVKILGAGMKKFCHFLVGWIGNHDSDFAETFHSPSLPGQGTAVSTFCSGNFSFRRNELMKFEILTFSPAPRNFAIAWWAELERRIQIFLKLFTAFQCQDRKLMCSVFAPVIYLLAKTNQRDLKFWPCHLIKEILAFFGRLNWKQGVRFCWNFLQPLTLRKENCCSQFLLKQFTF